MITRTWSIISVKETQTATGKAFLEVANAGDDGKEHKAKIWDRVMWPTFKQNKVVSVELDKNDKGFWDVKTAVGVTAESLPPPTTPTELPQHKEAIEKSKAEVPPKPVNPQELGLAHKLFSDAWIAGFIDENLPDGKEMVLKHKLWMRLMILGR